jgi:hypothetical protein
MVLEIPPAVGGTIVGTVMDCWQTPLEDVGYADVDKDKGGKYLILPPGYKEKVPAGYISLPSTNYEGYARLPRVGAKPTLPQSHTENRSGCIRFQPSLIHQKQSMPTRPTSLSTARYRTICVSSNR